MLITRESKKNEKMPGWMVDGTPIKRQFGMIYWYSWGDHEFDIRVMRRALGLPENHPDDKWFMAVPPDACGSFQRVMMHLTDALGGLSFSEIMAAHDKQLDADAEAELQEHRASQEMMKKMPKQFKLGEYAGLKARVLAGEDLSGTGNPIPYDDCPF
jgi:hypothetical protein